MNDTRSKILRYTATVYTGGMLLCMSQNLTGSVLNDIMTSYKMDLDNGGMMSFFQYLGGILAILAISRLADRLRKPVMLIGAFTVLCLMLLGISLFPPYKVFLLLYMLLGGSLCVIDVGDNAVLSDMHKENRDTVLSINHGVCGLGAVLIPVVTVMVGTANWQLTYRIVAGVVAFIVVLHCFMYGTGKKAVDSTTVLVTDTVNALPASKYFSDGKNWIGALCIFGFGVCQGGVTVWCVKFCREMFPERSALACGLALSAYWAGATLCRLAMGIVPALKRMDSRRLCEWGGVTAAAALFLGVISRNYYGAILGIFLMGILNAPTLPRVVGLMNSWYPYNSGQASSFTFISMYLGYALIPLVMGVTAASFGMVVMMMIPTAGTLVSGIAGFLLPKTE